MATEIIVALISGASALLVSIVSNHASSKKLLKEAEARTAQKAAEENETMKQGLQALLRDRLYYNYNKFYAEGYAPIYAKENFENMYNKYHELGANGVMDQLADEFMKLPTSKKEDKA